MYQAKGIQSACWLSGWIRFSISSRSSKSGTIRWRCTVMFWYWPSWSSGLLVESVPKRTKASSSLVSAKTWQRHFQCKSSRLICLFLVFVNVQWVRKFTWRCTNFWMTFLASSKGGSSPGAELDMENPTSMHNTKADYTKQTRHFSFQRLVAINTFELL